MVLFTHPDTYNEVYLKLGNPKDLYISVEHRKYGWFFKARNDPPRHTFNQSFSEVVDAIHIDIYAPDTNDSEQLIHMRHHVMPLACGLAVNHSLFSSCAGPYDLIPNKPCCQQELKLCEQDHGWHRKFDELPLPIRFSFNEHGSSYWSERLLSQRLGKAPACRVSQSL